jgi:valyl-tRNA synthetase
MPGGFAGDPDVMDTWATSSLTPQLVARWGEDADLFERVFPMDVRPQAHDIIRTWLFTTVLRSHLELDLLPWRHATISGFVTDPDRKKMSKSKGNVVTPFALLEEHGSDGVRYWAAGGRPGADTVFDPGQMRVGRRLAMKLLNASKFVLAKPEPLGAITEVADRGMLTRLALAVAASTEALTAFEYTPALEKAESFFWFFCDDYLELIKARRYGDHGEAGAASANSAMLLALSTLLRLFAPFLPFVTEEVWSWWQAGSVHRAAWPNVEELWLAIGGPDDNASEALVEGCRVLGEVRKKKSEEKKPLRTPVIAAIIRAPRQNLELLDRIWPDVSASGVFHVTPQREESAAFESVYELGEPEARS